MANDLVIRALKANAKELNLSSRNITELSKGFEKLTRVSGIRLNNNRLTALPQGLQGMRQVGELDSV